MKPLYSIEEMKLIRNELKAAGKKVVFTNGCFDILHPGHLDYLAKAKAMGDVLVVGLNSDQSVTRLKGEKRPIMPQADRAVMLAGLKSVDYVVVFEDDTPFFIISELIPDILVKGGDWAIENIVGKDIVEAHGGEVKNISFVSFTSTTNVIQEIVKRYCQ